jgi:23S rRNA (cytidine1920-2'-O)/16S rRNA (cytidine1409-2'-O)-methyltransferase
MVKPQFEVGRERVGKGGVVRNDDDRSAAVDIVVEAATSLGLEQQGRVESRVHGPKGNREIFVLLGRPTRAGGGGRHEG